MTASKVAKSKLAKFRLFLLYSFPAVLFCSYFPIIPIASTASTNYELSLPLIWLFLFSVLSLKDFVAYIYNIYKKKSASVLLLLFPFYLSLTSIWSPNPLRAILTSGIFWCLIVTGVTILTSLKPLVSQSKFLKIFFFSSATFCLLCWLQSILDVMSVGREATLLCSGCTSRMFGFPHPSGLAIEPQFMGNLLLAPTFTALFLLLKPKSDKNTPFSHKALLIFSFLFSSTLFLTFSRGAIYAFLLGFLLLLVLEIFKLKNRQFWRALPLLLISGLFVILAQGVFSALSPTNSTFLGGIEKSLSQMTLGKVNLNLEPKAKPESKIESSKPETAESEPVFDGYVEESTNTRLNFNRIALKLAPKNAKTLLFGYGLGSAGEVMFKEGKTSTPYEIVQNEPLSLLLETGLVGILLALLFLIIILQKIIKSSPSPERYFLLSLTTSFVFSLLFFSGLPNALHIYLFPVFLIACLPRISPRG